VFLSLCYIVFRWVLQLATLRLRSNDCKELEIVVLRHELAILRRRTRRPAMAWTDRCFLAAASRLLPRARWPSFIITPGTLLPGVPLRSRAPGAVRRRRAAPRRAAIPGRREQLSRSLRQRDAFVQRRARPRAGAVHRARYIRRDLPCAWRRLAVVARKDRSRPVARPFTATFAKGALYETSQRHVELLIGSLLTDDDLRSEFTRAPFETLAAFCRQGWS